MTISASPTHKPSPTKGRSAKRQAIVEAARIAFQENGVDGTSMDALAAKAGVSKRTVYNHFATKEVLVSHLITEQWREAMQAVPHNYDAKAPLLDQLIKLLVAEMMVFGTKEYIDLARVALGHLLFHPEALRDELAKLAEQESALSQWLKCALKDKRLKTLEIEEAANQLHNLVKGSCFWPQLLQVKAALTEDEMEKLAEDSAAMFLGFYQVT